MWIYVAILITWAGLALAQDPIIKIVETSPETNDMSKKTITAIRDLDVTMECNVDNLPLGTNVKWQKITQNGNKEDSQDITENEGTSDNTKYSLEKPTTFTWKLRIKRIQLSDAAKYQCFVHVTRESKVLDFRHVSVMIKPTLDPALTSTDMVVREGDHVDLLCNATGLPMPMIEWSRQGGALLPIGREKYRGSKLSIEDIRYNDRGLYMCHVFNSVGEIKRYINVGVRFRPQVMLLEREVYQAPGYQIELQCFVEANPFPDASQMKWVFGSTSISSSSDRYSLNQVQGAFSRLKYELIFHRVTEADYGKYTCQVKNSEGTRSASVVLKRTDVPQKSIKLQRIIPEYSAGQSALSATATLLLSALIATYLL